MQQRIFAIFFLLLGCCLARPGNIADEIEELYTEFGTLANDEIEEAERSTTVLEDPEIKEIAEREYENTMGRIVAVNLAHWRKGLLTRTEDAKQDKREYHENVQEMIETANEGNGFFFNQGDMIMDCDLYEELHPGKNCRSGGPGVVREKRNAVRTRKRLWTSRVIQYQIPGFMSHVRSNVLTAMNNIQRNSCLRFVPYRGSGNYITFDRRNGCSSRIGMRYVQKSKQTISLGSGCNFVGTITHELLHAVGFYHEQARADRDKFVEVKWENILEGFSDQFDKYVSNALDNVGQDYDFKSIMHYDKKAFSKNGLDTIVRIDKPNENFGTSTDEMSPQDITEINTLYDCRTRNYGWTQWSSYTPCDKDCWKERQRYCYHSGNPKSCGGNVNAYGVETEKVKCGRDECPAKVNGHWGRWSDFSKCDAQCNDGKRKRYRKCDNPVPEHGGKPCPGNSREEVVCTIQRCRLGNEDTDFDSKGLGMWRDVGQIKWKRNKGFTQTMNTGPNGDHTTGKGYYLYMESSGQPAGRRAILESNELTAPKGGQCMKLFYTMYGESIGSLSVVLQQGRNGPTTVFQKKGQQGIDWIGAKISLDIPEGTRYKIRIIAQVGNGKQGYSDIAIDDVYIDPGLCFCQDDYASCKKWKTEGYCRKSVQFMSKHCARSCDTCECKDDNSYCPGWAAQQNGCENNRAFMRLSCKKSCKVCHQPQGAMISSPGNRRPAMCMDKDKTKCPAWHKVGECSRNPGYMTQNCALSCGTCVCKDKHSRCPEWAKKEECYGKNKKWMLDNCVKSCHVCACGDNHLRCGLWARLGECEKNADFMQEQCKKSCKKC